MNIVSVFTLLAIILIICLGTTGAQVSIVLTAALTHAYFDFRKKQYIQLFEQVADTVMVPISCTL